MVDIRGTIMLADGRDWLGSVIAQLAPQAGKPELLTSELGEA